MDRIEAHLSVREKGTFPSQPQPNPKTQCEVQDSNPSKSVLGQAKSITTLQSGKIIDKEIPMKADKPKESVEARVRKDLVMMI